jgi:hypothetical protein
MVNKRQNFHPIHNYIWEIQDRNSTQLDIIKCYDQRRDKGWEDSAEGILAWLDHQKSILESSQQATKTQIVYPKDKLNTAFTMLEGHEVMCKTNEGAIHQAAIDDDYVFQADDDTPAEVLHHMFHISKQSGRNFIQIPLCDWKDLHCTENHLLRDCPIYKDLQDKEKLDHISKTKRCYNCYKRGHSSGACPSKQHCRVGDCKGKHNTALHYDWKEKSMCVAFLTKNVSPVSLLTSPVMVATDNSALKKETNVIHDNGASISLMSKEIADAVGLHGETRPLGLSVVRNSSLVQQAFKAQINLHDTEGNEISKAWVNVISSFVDLKKVDGSIQAAQFPHLANINFPKPYIGGKYHILLGNDNHHLSVPKQNNIVATENPQSFPYACLTPLGWCAAGPTLPQILGDPVLNMMVKSASQRIQHEYRSRVIKGQTEAEGRKN